MSSDEYLHGSEDIAPDRTSSESLSFLSLSFATTTSSQQPHPSWSMGTRHTCDSIAADHVCASLAASHPRAWIRLVSQRLKRAAIPRLPPMRSMLRCAGRRSFDKYSAHTSILHSAQRTRGRSNTSFYRPTCSRSPTYSRSPTSSRTPAYSHQPNCHRLYSRGTVPRLLLSPRRHDICTSSVA